ncbi:hypothetical protein TBLA_0C02830 [Henningerozyma blattae CBS 6284]|uniref:Uncharacterized protein n=1 Tax=Henningerozyma blattae (strain ATCC 34711 / CBS 6284 / DSM 70876 / NBRC 10599 / NRRL Y-10934 / UCD 77-7) TaxID=1071380 RepID=I2H137_HENB6|nr:hypothetical protein TBLA_0C02830 [Tetrapisispora blattae CBS 6284]CCH60089.1 hypothetical protein TBLA_0C02830 [Tetrapisispora blattae CBS 6284]
MRLYFFIFFVILLLKIPITWDTRYFDLFYIPITQTLYFIDPTNEKYAKFSFWGSLLFGMHSIIYRIYVTIYSCNYHYEGLKEDILLNCQSYIKSLTFSLIVNSMNIIFGFYTLHYPKLHFTRMMLIPSSIMMIIDWYLFWTDIFGKIITVFSIILSIVFNVLIGIWFKKFFFARCIDA